MHIFVGLANLWRVLVAILILGSPGRPPSRRLVVVPLLLGGRVGGVLEGAVLDVWKRDQLHNLPRDAPQRSKVVPALACNARLKTGQLRNIEIIYELPDPNLNHPLSVFSSFRFKQFLMLKNPWLRIRSEPHSTSILDPDPGGKN